ncbi:MAG: thiamine-phosphate kinase [Rhizobiaceae bacterium]
MERPGEFELIERYFAPLAASGSFALKDDAALLQIPDGKELVVTQDAIASGVHFFPDDPPAKIAKKAIRVNLSDLAAKGAKPFSFSMALGLHPDWDEDWLSDFAEGLAEDCENHSLSLCGGDTFKVAERPVISITAFGTVEKQKYASRLGAESGDQLFVSGQIGLGALGLLVRNNKLETQDRETADALLSRYLLPEPPLALASVISEFASASMDISDGFIGDIEKLAKASQVGFDIPLKAVPLPRLLDGLDADAPEISIALTGGDDYQFVFSVPQDKMDDMLASAGGMDIQLTHLATANNRPGIVRILDEDNNQIQVTAKSWHHFE